MHPQRTRARATGSAPHTRPPRRPAGDGHAPRPAAVYIRESEPGQSEYSPELQLAGARELLERNGYYVAMVVDDRQRGGDVNRKGYQQIKHAVRTGLIEAVGVYKMSRWGRDLIERLQIGKEFDKLDVPVFDAQRGKADTPGLERLLYAWQDEEFVHNLSWTMVRAMPKAVKDGKYPARTPIGYQRVVPQDRLYAPGDALDLVPDPQYAPLVQQIFEKYVAGMSTRAIARWLNTLLDQYPNPHSPQTGRWHATLIGRLLRRRVYIGEVEWGKTHSGKYNQYDGPVLRSGEGDCKPARHPAIVDRATWEAAQVRLDGERRHQDRTQRGGEPALLLGFLRCAGCGGPMTPQVSHARGHGNGLYACYSRHTGRSECREPSVSMRIAGDAVLREVARLEGRPWEPQPFEQVLRRDQHAEERTRLRAQTAAVQAELDASVVALRKAGDFSPAVLEAFRRDAQSLDEQLRTMQAQLDALPQMQLDADLCAKVHAELVSMDVSREIDSARADSDTQALRHILRLTVSGAAVVERVGGGRGNHTTWARAQVEWTPEVQALLEAGLLTLAPAPEPPVAALMTPEQRARERARRYRERKRAQAH
jgi:DNA invertase Pin-like site-specific DNA recombinase